MRDSRQLFTRCGSYNGYDHTMTTQKRKFSRPPSSSPSTWSIPCPHRLRQRGSPEKHPLPPGVIGINQEQPDQQNSRPGNIVLQSRTQAIRRLRFGAGSTIELEGETGCITCVVRRACDIGFCLVSVVLVLLLLFNKKIYFIYRIIYI